MSGPPESAQLIDARLVKLSDGRWGVSVEGRRVAGFSSTCPGAAFIALGQLVHMLANLERCSEERVLLEVLFDPQAAQRATENVLRRLFGVAGFGPDPLDDIPPEKHA